MRVSESQVATTVAGRQHLVGDAVHCGAAVPCPGNGVPHGLAIRTLTGNSLPAVGMGVVFSSTTRWKEGMKLAEVWSENSSWGSQGGEVSKALEPSSEHPSSTNRVSPRLYMQWRNVSLCDPADDTFALSASILSWKLLNFLEMLIMSIKKDHLRIFLTKYEYLLSDRPLARWRYLWTLLPWENDMGPKGAEGRDCKTKNR